MKHRWSFYRESPCWVGVQDVPLTHEQKQSTALFAAQGLASPTQSDLNLKCKAWHCKLDLHTLNFYVMVKFS
ncbi:hypothetical protein F7P82_15575 [Acinetobacter guillouiae]|nr:hypothetical protein F7P82_15575 [Acinetobacter guillouiae]